MTDPDGQNAIDRAIIERVARGEQAAFSQLYDRLSNPLYALCLRMLGDAAEAEDVLQEAFVQIWRNAARYDAAQSSVFGWAVHLTRCKVIDRLRRRGRRLRLYVPGDDADDPAARVASSDGDAADTAGRNELAQSVRRRLLDLPPEQRQAIELAFFSDLSHHEIASRLGQPLGSIKARIRRGLLKMRTGLEQWT
jgi:RNA polymerase sigma-70 factor (ECF subfamily)